MASLRTDKTDTKLDIGRLPHPHSHQLEKEAENEGPGAYEGRRARAKCSVRLVIAIMGILCPGVCYLGRQNLNMAIIAMVEKPSNPTYEGPEPVVTYGPKYAWDQAEQNLVTGAFFWTYVAVQIPAGVLAEWFGPKYVLLLATLGTCLVSALSAVAASAGLYTFVASRMLLGIFQAALYPACYTLFARWLSHSERTHALPLLCLSLWVGSIVAMTSTGYFNEHPLLGWPWAFYMPAVLCALWSLVWLFVGSNCPQTHRFISKRELDLIERNRKLDLSTTPLSSSTSSSSTMAYSSSSSTSSSSLASSSSSILPNHKASIGVDVDVIDLKNAHTYTGPTPVEPKTVQSLDWLKILKSQHVWVLVVGMFATNWSLSLILLMIPKYLDSIFVVSNVENGNINSFLYIVYCLVTPFVSLLAARVERTKPFGITRLQTRKLFQTFALLGQTIGLLLLTLVDKKHLAVIVLFIMLITFTMINGGEIHLATEISLEFAGTIYAICNCVGSSTGTLVPILNTMLVHDIYDKSQWDMFFYVSALICLFGGLVFALFARNDPQNFAKTPKTSDSKPKELAQSNLISGENHTFCVRLKTYKSIDTCD